MNPRELLLTAIGTACFAFTAAVAAGRDYVLVEDGRPNATIVLAQKPTRAAQFAAFELQHHIRQISGVTLPIARDGEAASGVKILVGESEGTKSLGLDAGALKLEEYLVKFAPEAVVLMGRDRADFTAVKYDLKDPASRSTWPGIWDERATTYAVYDFLEKSCGVRWFSPTEGGTRIPQRKTLAVKGRDIRRAPFFVYRDAYGDNPLSYDAATILWRANSDGFKNWEAAAYADLHRKYPDANAYNGAKSLRIRLFHLRMRVGGEKCRCNHSLYHYYDLFWEPSKDPENAKYFAGKRPELFAQGYENVPPQMCYTSQALIKQVAQEARDYFDKGGYPYKTVLCNAPLGLKWGEKFFAVEPMDNSSFCKCAACQAWLKRKLGEVEEYSKGTHSEYFFNFVNEVARELKKTHPNARIVTLAYMTHAYPPVSFKLEPSVAVQFCFACNRAPFTSGYQHELRLLREWAKEKERPLYLWLYYTFPKETADNGGYHCFPGFFAHAIGEQFRVFHECNVRGMFHCGWGQEVEAYVTYKLMDDPTLDVDDLLEDYFTGLYGKAAKPMKALYLGIEKTYTDKSNYPKDSKVSGAALQWMQLGTAERMERFGKLMTEARQAADTDVARKNVDLFDQAVWSYMVAGRKQYTDRMAAPIPSVTAPRVAAAGGDPAKVDWNKAAPLGDPWYDRGGGTPSKRMHNGRIAHDGQYLYLELVDPCDVKKLHTSGTVFCYDDWEVFVAGQRAQPYRQFAVSPSAKVVALSHGEVNWRQNVTIEEHGVKAVSDVSAPDKWVTRMIIPLQDAVAGGAKPGAKLYMNIMRVTGPALTGTGSLGLDTWVSYCTVHEVDRLAEVQLQ